MIVTLYSILVKEPSPSEKLAITPPFFSAPLDQASQA